MSYIEPNSNIWILRNVPLEENYTHTYFPWNSTNGQPGNTTTQFNALSAYIKPDTSYRGKTYSFSLTKYNYQRKNINEIMVKIPYDILYDCNYLIFQNLAHGNKKFYAFIKSVDYINENVSKITYSIDVMQTWHFDYTLNKCFVEREHSAEDNRGANILPEPVSLGEYVDEDSENIVRWLSEKWYIVIVVTFGTDGLGALSAADGHFTSGTWNQVEYYQILCYDPNGMQNVPTPAQINTQIKGIMNAVTIINRQNAIVTLYMCPESLLPNDDPAVTFYESLE